MPHREAARTTRGTRISGWIAAAALTALGAAAEPIGYIVGEVPGETTGLLEVDLASGAVVPVGQFGLGDAWVQALALAPDGVLYGLDSTGPRLLRIDATTGTAVVVTALDFGDPNVSPEGLTFDACGRLFATAWIGVPSGARAVLLELDPATGAVTELSPAGSERVSSVAARGEELFAWTPLGLARIDPATHEPVQVGPVPEVMGGPFAFDAEGDLWGYGLWPPGAIPDPLPPIALIHRIDPVTGDPGESVAAMPVHHVGLAIAPPPGLCASGAPIGVPALSPLGVAVLVLSLIVLGALLLRRADAATGAGA